MELDYKTLSSIEGLFGDTALGIKIIVGGDLPSDMISEDIRIAASNAIDKIKEAILTQVYAEDPRTEEISHKEKEELLGCFPDPIYVEEIPNGYIDAYYTKHLPWFVVTTPVGRITLGWRRSVISISWEDSAIKDTAEDLFPDEDVTKFTKGIHAWSPAKAKIYIHKLLGLSDIQLTD